MRDPSPNGVLVLEGGPGKTPREFVGQLFGAKLNGLPSGKADRGFGEIVFNTAMTGYQEILTDPSYYGQIVCMTTAHIGNTGVNTEDVESDKAQPAGFLVNDYCDLPSNWRSTQPLSDYLSEHQIPGLCRVDTRALTRHLRDKGVIRGVILPIEDRKKGVQLLKELPAFEGRDLIKEVTTQEPYRWPKEKKQSKFRIAALDLGLKKNFLREFEKRDCEVHVFPAQSSASNLLEAAPDGIFLSNGPGDPKTAHYAIQTVTDLIGKLPIFGVCMGHQVIALALGGKAYKMKFGHHGANQPVFNKASGQVEITSQNHGYAIAAESLSGNIEVTHFNLNDKSVEGLCDKKNNVFSVQYHPEACPGPHDSNFIFDQFVEAMERHVSKVSRTHH